MDNNLKRFDVILVDFGTDTIGSEQGGIRPAIIVQNDTGNTHSTTTLAMPLTTQIKHYGQPTHAIIKSGGSKGLSKDSMVLGEALRQISAKRIIRRLGVITDDDEKKAIKRVYDANFGEFLL